jgi:hypothetical protein
MNVPALLRGAVLAGSVALIAAGVPERSAETQPILRLPADWHAGEAGDVRIVRALRRSASGPLLAERQPGRLPAAAELDALASLGARATILAATPEQPRVVLRASSPISTPAERSMAVGFELLGAPGDSVIVRLGDRAGALDSAHIRLDAAGRAAGSFRMRPPRDGWQEWSLDASGVGRIVGTWVRPATPLRVLVASGPPDWESRFVLRALDEAGVQTAAILPLGRDLGAGDAGSGMPVSDDALSAFDAVVVLPGARLGDAEVRALQRFAARGGGVLGVGRTDLWRAFGIADEAAETTADAAAIRWQAPAELAPLPGVELRVAAAPIAGLRAPAFAAALHGDAALLAIRPYGYGRAAALGLTETWRWRMEAGSIAEHREFWHALADWLAADADAGPRLHIASTIGALAQPVDVEVADGDGRSTSTLVLRRPDGTSERLELHAHGNGVQRARFVPVQAGEHRIAFDDGSVRAAFVASADDVAVDDATARLALLAWASGGALVRPDSVGAWREAWLAGAAVHQGSATWPRWLLFALIVGAAFGEWTVRRLRGLA